MQLQSCDTEISSSPDGILSSTAALLSDHSTIMHGKWECTNRYL